MKNLVICNSDILSAPLISYLLNNGELAGIVMPDKSFHNLSAVFKSLGVSEANLYKVCRRSIHEDLSDIIEKVEPDMILTLTFPWKIPDSLLSARPNGFINFHFGLLPKYKGADPVFWQLKNGEKNGGISIHIMNHEVDGGAVVLRKELPVIPGETYGIHCQRLGLFAGELLPSVYPLLKANKFVTQNAQEALFYNAPSEGDLTIRWQEQSADEIENLVNAGNPRYGGAVSSLRGMKLRVLEVSPADVNNASGVAPGTIVYADAVYGLIVACLNNQFLKINVISVPEGYLSGIKLFSLGYKAGDIFL